ncbi:UPF0016 membrane protein [Verticillium dahliae VDG1]|nr:UPF0016 membrane protein [Verticillium dahliae VDG1]
MSDLQRAWAKRKVDAIPEPFDELPEDNADELSELPDHLDDGDSSSASSASSTGTIIPSPSQRLFARPGAALSRPGRSWEPVPWTTYFERELFLEHDATTTYHAYLTSPSPQGGPLFVAHHGAGSSALSFALVAAEIRRALPHAGFLMHAYLSTRPAGFASIEAAIEWHVRSRTVRNALSARTSVPALLVERMQGRYALQVFPEAGHFIHEDLPEKTAVALVDFFRRNDRGALVLPPKVGDLLRQGKRV